jgi:hypothetical protein
MLRRIRDAWLRRRAGRIAVTMGLYQFRADGGVLPIFGPRDASADVDDFDATLTALGLTYLRPVTDRDRKDIPPADVDRVGFMLVSRTEADGLRRRPVIVER